MTDIVAADIGGTHARFAIATIREGRVVALRGEAVLMVADYPGLDEAWTAYARQSGGVLPRAAGIAVATPVGGPVLQLTNSPWVMRPALIGRQLGLDRYSLVNDFGAVAHAVAQLDPAHFRHLCGPARPLPETGVISVVGPGTGLGVAMVSRGAGGARIVEAEGGHADFSPLDAVDDRILARLRLVFGRVSVERVVSGAGLARIHAVLACEDDTMTPVDDAALWARALSGQDALATAALDRFCLSLGAAAGDIALTQGAAAVVIAGGLGLRLADRLAGSGFEARFLDKGRLRDRMATMPVKLITYPEPGLFGAAVAFAHEHL